MPVDVKRLDFIRREGVICLRSESMRERNNSSHMGHNRSKYNISRRITLYYTLVVGYVFFLYR